MLFLCLTLGTQCGNSPKEQLRRQLEDLSAGGRPAYGHQDDLVYGHAWTVTDLEGLSDPAWWTARLAPAISGFPLAYVLTWRNAHDRPGHFYGPWSGFAYEDDFRNWKESGSMTFL